MPSICTCEVGTVIELCGKFLFCPVTIQFVITSGNMVWLGAPWNANEQSKICVPSLNDGQKDCFLSFDEIHVKPGLQYQGKYVLGNAQNTTEPIRLKPF